MSLVAGAKPGIFEAGEGFCKLGHKIITVLRD